MNGSRASSGNPSKCGWRKGNFQFWLPLEPTPDEDARRAECLSDMTTTGVVETVGNQGNFSPIPSVWNSFFSSAQIQSIWAKTLNHTLASEGGGGSTCYGRVRFPRGKYFSILPTTGIEWVRGHRNGSMATPSVDKINEMQNDEIEINYEMI